MSPRVIAALSAVLLVGLVLGVVAASVLDDDAGSGDSETAPPTQEECAEADAVIAAASDRIAEIGAIETEQDATYFAAVLVEQRTISFAMEAVPECFTLEERAISEGLLAGLRGLLAAGDSTSGGAPTIELVPPDGPPDQPEE